MSIPRQSAGTTKYSRDYLLSDGRRNDVLALSEVEQYGRDCFGDRSYVSVYDLRPDEWYPRGIRLLARTAVECTRDRLADLIGRDIAATARAAPRVSGCVVADPFAGSGNTLYWIQRHVSGSRGVGFELDDAVFELSRANLSMVVGLGVELEHRDYKAGLRELSVRDDELLIVFIAPPWGDAFSEKLGLDLRRTKPPVAQIIDLIASTYPNNAVLLGVQVHESALPESVTDLTSRCDWSALRTYTIDGAGKNHGLLLGALGWTAGA